MNDFVLTGAEAVQDQSPILVDLGEVDGVPVEPFDGMFEQLL